MKQKMAREAKKAGEAPPVPVPPGGPAKEQVQKDKNPKKGTCIKYNRGNCKVPNYKWDHSCSTCSKPGCAAWKHDEAAKKKTG